MPAEETPCKSRIPPSARRDFLLRTIIFANGECSSPCDPLAWLCPGDRIIAADGGARRCLALGLTPHLLIGDFDSLPAETVETFRTRGAEIRRYPAEKDETDLELALYAALEQETEEVLVFGALGGRWDMTLGNLLLLAHPDFREAPIRIVDGPQSVTLLPRGRAYEIAGQEGDTVSLIPLGGDAKGVTTRGLRYPLKGGTLRFGATRGLSNLIVRSPASVTVEDGLLLCLVIANTSPPLPNP